ncbi:MAG: sulfotransferase [Gemmataceae bacterium]
MPASVEKQASNAPPPDAPRGRSWTAPHLPFLAFASLEVWHRLLYRPRAHIPGRYLPRMILGIVVSCIITVITLPERLIVDAWLRLRRRKTGLPGPVFILGYYRSGTTHLQFLLSRDPNLYSPRWTQTLTPRGFAVSWNLLNFFLLPLFPDKRPQDNAAFGTDIPAEDDFALANAALASSLVGRHVVPQHRDFYDRFHDLNGLSGEELERWQREQKGFLDRIGLLAGARRVLLKTPSHTARVAALLHLLRDYEGTRFIHISRKPEATYRSNLGLHKVLNERYHLQDPLPEEEIEARVVQEYLATERKYLAERGEIPNRRHAEIRMEDLLADPLGEIQRLYEQLELPYTPEFEQRLLEYLDANRSYEPNRHRESASEKERLAMEQLEPLRLQFRHDQPAIPKKEPGTPTSMQPAVRGKLLRSAMIQGLLVGLATLLPLTALTWITGLRLDGLVWLSGIAVGLRSITIARRGCLGLGIWNAAVTLLVGMAGTLITTGILQGDGGHGFRDLLQSTWDNIPLVPVIFWYLLGTLGAFRLGTRRWI